MRAQRRPNPRAAHVERAVAAQRQHERRAVARRAVDGGRCAADDAELEMPRLRARRGKVRQPNVLRVRRRARGTQPQLPAAAGLASLGRLGRLVWPQAQQLGLSDAHHEARLAAAAAGGRAQRRLLHAARHAAEDDGLGGDVGRRDAQAQRLRRQRREHGELRLDGERRAAAVVEAEGDRGGARRDGAQRERHARDRRVGRAARLARQERGRRRPLRPHRGDDVAAAAVGRGAAHRIRQVERRAPIERERRAAAAAAAVAPPRKEDGERERRVHLVLGRVRRKPERRHVTQPERRRCAVARARVGRGDRRIARRTRRRHARRAVDGRDGGRARGPRQRIAGAARGGKRGVGARGGRRGGLGAAPRQRETRRQHRQLAQHAQPQLRRERRPARPPLPVLVGGGAIGRVERRVESARRRRHRLQLRAQAARQQLRRVARPLVAAAAAPAARRARVASLHDARATASARLGLTHREADAARALCERDVSQREARPQLRQRARRRDHQLAGRVGQQQRQRLTGFGAPGGGGARRAVQPQRRVVRVALA